MHAMESMESPSKYTGFDRLLHILQQQLISLIPIDFVGLLFSMIQAIVRWGLNCGRYQLTVDYAPLILIRD